VIDRHYKEISGAAEPYWALLDAVVARQASLMAHWMLIGFIHGVMNTDNMSIAGETIDYGPCAFMDSYHPMMVYSSIDETGRYAFSNQPRIAQWNLARLAETLLPLLGDDEDLAVTRAQAAIERFTAAFDSAYGAGLARKLGLLTSRPDDAGLAQDLLRRMADNGADFTLTFRRLCAAVPGAGQNDAVRELFAAPQDFDAWAVLWRARLAEEGGDSGERRAAMLAVNPLYIPRNHLVEEAIAAAQQDDYSLFEALLAVLAAPFDERPGKARYAAPPAPEEIVRQTFCGT